MGRCLSARSRCLTTFVTDWRRDQVRSEPHPVPPGWKVHAYPMIMLNLTEQLAESAMALLHPQEEWLAGATQDCAGEILRLVFRTPG